MINAFDDAIVKLRVEMKWNKPALLIYPFQNRPFAGSWQFFFE